MNLEDLLGSWTKPSSDTEQDKQERTERMVKKAISGHPEFHDCTLNAYTKGSCPINIRAESDVDIALQCFNTFYCTKGSHARQVCSDPAKCFYPTFVGSGIQTNRRKAPRTAPKDRCRMRSCI